MKNTFNPDKATEVEDDIFDRFMEQMQARSQSKQLQQVADSLRVLLEMTRQDSAKAAVAMGEEAMARFGELGKQVSKEVTDSVTKEVGTQVNDALKATSKAVGDSQDRIMARADSLSTSLGRVEKVLKDIQNEPKEAPDNAGIRGLLTAVASLRSDIESLRGDDRVQTLIDMVKEIRNAPPPEPPPRPKWVFTVERDDYARIKNVTATAN